MSGKELVTAFNNLVTMAQAQGLTKFKPVKRFKTTADGLRRIEALRKALNLEVVMVALPGQVEQPQEPVASASVTSAEPTPVPSTQEPAMAKKRKGRALSNGGGTIREMTERYNRIVEGMSKKRREQIKWAKVHTSLFGTIKAAKEQLARLEKAIAAT